VISFRDTEQYCEKVETMMQPKKNPDRSYGEKLISLFAKLLFTGERYSLTELAKLLDCSKQTVLRLIDDITFAYDVRIHDEIRGNRKYIWIERTRGLEPAALLSESEHRTLQMCRAFTEHLLGRTTYKEMERAVEKSGLHLPVGLEPGDPAFGVVRTGVINYSTHEAVLRTLIEGMDRRRVCEIGYRNLTAKRAKTFRIKPLKIFAHRESVYVHARLAKSPGKPYKTPKYDPLLALHRCTRAELTETPFRRPANYDFDKVMNQGFGVWTQKKFRVVMELTGWAASMARERVWSPDQEIVEQGDVTRLSFWSTSEPEVVALVLSFGDNARVLEPSGVVGMVTGELAGALGRYGVGSDG
jgi:predicted DNA-binding transcriptional regulator YafY